MTAAVLPPWLAAWQRFTAARIAEGRNRGPGGIDYAADALHRLVADLAAARIAETGNTRRTLGAVYLFAVTVEVQALAAKFDEAADAGTLDGLADWIDREAARLITAGTLPADADVKAEIVAAWATRDTRKARDLGTFTAGILARLNTALGVNS